MYTRDCEVRDFKLDLNRHSRVLLPVFSFNGWKSKLSSHKVLFASGELFDGPHHGVNVRNVLDSAHIRFEHWAVDILRDGHDYLNVVGHRFRLELSLRFDQVLDLGPREVFDNTIGPDQGLHMRIQTVSH